MDVGNTALPSDHSGTVSDTSTLHSPARLLIVTPLAPMYRDPDVAAEQVSQALLGMPLVVLDSRPGWLRVRTPDAYEGWIEASGAGTVPEGSDGPAVEVTDLWINLRLRNDSQLAPAAQAPIGTHLALVGEAEGWVQLQHPDGRRLWTEAKRVARLGDLPLRPLEPKAMVRTALRFMRTPYLWGGCSPLGLDCSGLVQLVYRLHGLQIQRDAGEQALEGAPSPSPATADLVFFAPGGSDGEITHVGMMLDGDRFIHALGSDYVRINRLSEPKWRSLLHSTRRYL